MSEKEYGDPVVGAMLGLCIGYYLGKGATTDEVISLAKAVTEEISRRLQADQN